jgi:hypothetical protein
VVNWSLEQHLPSRGRALSLHVLSVVRVGGGVILTEAKSAPSLGEIYLNHCALHYDDPSWLLSASHEYMENADGQSNMRKEKEKSMTKRATSSRLPSCMIGSLSLAGLYQKRIVQGESMHVS